MKTTDYRLVFVNHVPAGVEPCVDREPKAYFSLRKLHGKYCDGVCREELCPRWKKYLENALSKAEAK